MSLFIHIVWNTNPWLQFNGEPLIRWYSLLMGLAVFIILGGMRWFFVHEKAPQRDYWPAVTLGVIMSFIGARLAHCFFYDWAYFSQHPIQIVYVWQGGLASHGALVGLITGLVVYSRFFGQVYYWWLFDRLAIILPLAGIPIRLGNLFNSELYGIPAELPWAMVFQQVDAVPRHPSQLYEVLFLTIMFLIMLVLYRRKGATAKFGLYSACFVIMMTVFRFVFDFWKVGEPLWLGLKTGQLLSLPWLGVGAVLFYLSYKGKLQ